MKLDRDILKSLVVSSYFDHGKKNIMGKCPWCNFTEWGISVEEGHQFNCFRASKCGESGNIFKFLKKIGRLDLINVSEKIDYSQKLENIIIKKLENENLDLIVPTITLPIGFKRIQNHPYLDERNFTEYEKYKVGMTNLDYKFKNYVIFQIEEEGKLKGYVSRSIHSKEYIEKWNNSHDKKIQRYSNSVNVDFAKLLRGYDEITSNTKTVILVEGLFKKINIDRLLELDKQEEIKCCVTFGAKISEEQVLKLQLKGIESVILMFDPDVINKIKKHSLQLTSEFESIQIGFNKDKSPDDFNLEDLTNVLDNLESPLNFYVKKVQILKLK